MGEVSNTIVGKVITLRASDGCPGMCSFLGRQRIRGSNASRSGGINSVKGQGRSRGVSFYRCVGGKPGSGQEISRTWASRIPEKTGR